MNANELRQCIDTIVIVMMENRSFDHVLGSLCLPEYGGRSDVDGIADLADTDYANPSQNATMIQPFVAKDEMMPSDLPHERGEIATQLAQSDIAGYTMTGFVQAFEQASGTSGQLCPPPMGLLPPAQIPVTSFLAREFALCDRWFAALPTSTQPNRLMALSGYSRCDQTLAGPLPEQQLVFDWLSQRPTPVRWRVYSEGLPFLTLMPRMWLPMIEGKNFKSTNALAQDFQSEGDGTFPQVIIVEPDYGDSPVHVSGHACDNHPPLPMSFGETFLQRVYAAVTANQQRWRKTLLVLCYDEHGGFYDHVAPLPIPYNPPPDANFSVPFESTGPRVPALLISPWVRRQAACHHVFDHTSILQLIAERFGSGPYSDSVDARRAAGIESLSAALDASIAYAAPPALAPIALAAPLPMTAAPPASTPARQAFATSVNQLVQSHGSAALQRYPAIARWQASR
jgi:phospholipase C